MAFLFFRVYISINWAVFITYTLLTKVMFLEAGPVVLHYDGIQWWAASQQSHTDAVALPNLTAADLICPDADVPHYVYVPPWKSHHKSQLLLI
jgi:hypothetical protein